MSGRYGREPLPMPLAFIKAVITLVNIAMVAVAAVAVWAAAMFPIKGVSVAAMSGGDVAAGALQRLLITALVSAAVAILSWLINWPLYRYAEIGDVHRPFAWAAGSAAVIMAGGAYATIRFVLQWAWGV
ncbi:MAG: hypothetical protein PVH31_06255 [Ectothiorhodospiraceae bacterium]|jgi:hypothetical protein